MPLITATDVLAEACVRLAQHPYVTVDTEFMRETTYYPRLCLIQMASADAIYLVDALAEQLDLAPFFALMADERVTKVFHAARQDIEIIWTRGQVMPVPLFDSQVAAMVCGFGDQVSYESLAASLAGARIDKSSRFTDWSRRPLSEAQLAYAAADVTHLRAVYEKLHHRLERTGRGTWLDDELAILTSPDTYDQSPERAHERVKARLRKPREIAILIEVAAWREREAQTRDVPRSRVMKDDALAEVAVAAPTSHDDLARLRAVPNGFERSRSAQDLLAAVARGLARDLDLAPVPREDRPASGGNGALVQLLKVLLQATAERHQVAPKLIATVDDLEQLATSETEDILPLKGWRREIFGDLALRLKAGDVTLGLEKGRVIAIPRP